MARKGGRPRKEGARHPGGKLRQDGIPPALWRRIRDHGVRLGVDPRVASVIGRLGLLRILSDIEVEVAFRAAEVYGRFETFNNLPRRAAASPSYQTGRGGAEIDMERLTTEEVNRLHRRMRRARRAFDELQAQFPTPGAREMFERVVVEDMEIPSGMHGDLAVFLRGLAKLWGMVPTEQGRPGKIRTWRKS
jgi:hypothetical protein